VVNAIFGAWCRSQRVSIRTCAAAGIATGP
jgi:hypothetical protein